MRQTNQLNQISKKFSPKQAKRALSYKFYIYQFTLSDMKIDISRGDDLQVFYSSKADEPQTDRSWTIQIFQTKSTEPDVELFMFSSFLEKFDVCIA